jgi:hypothetical protein
MARTFASVNEAWRELRHARNRAHEENDHAHHARHGYDPDQPRVAKGHSDGGQWTDTEGGENTSEILSDATPDNEWSPGSQYAQARGRGSVPVRIGNRWFEAEGGQAARLTVAQARQYDAVARVRELDPKWSPGPSYRRPDTVESYIRILEAEAGEAEAYLARLEAPPRVPNQRPQTTQEENKVIVEVAHWMARHPEYQIRPSSWLYQHRVLVEAYCGPPRPMEQLQRDAAMPKFGYEIHHNVEQTPARQDHFSRREIDAPDNLLRIPRLKHWEITGWFATRNRSYDMMTPRQYLRGKSWNERVDVGWEALIKHGVVKP